MRRTEEMLVSMSSRIGTAQLFIADLYFLRLSLGTCRLETTVITSTAIEMQDQGKTPLTQVNTKLDLSG